MEKVASILCSIFNGAGSSTVVGTSEGAVPDAEISSIFIYPIKSCRGISVPEASVTPTVLRAPGMNALKVPLKRKCEIVDDVSVWEWVGSAYDEGKDASDWLTEYIGKPSRLVRFNTSTEKRHVDPNYAPGYKICFSDGFPFMLISQGSLNSLNEHLSDPLPIDRFRPNILVDGCPPFSEDLWMSIQVNKLMFQGVKLCSRCKVPTINQETAIAGVEPTETLMKFRSDNALRQSNKINGKVYFGQNLVCKESPEQGKSIRVGDPIYVLQRFSSVLDVPV